LSHVNETLQELLERRLGELGHRRGRGENISLREAWLRLPPRSGGGRAISYETARRIRENGHANISDDTADALAAMLDVSVDEVLQAAGRRRRLGRFELPRRADRLTDRERQAVLGVVDAILDAAEGAGQGQHGQGRADRRSTPPVQRKAARRDRTQP